MIKLVNGRGQLGDCINQLLLNDYEKRYYCEEDVYIYHTWKLDTKIEEEQKKEFTKFKYFVDTNFNNRILLISTASIKDDWYVHYKQLSESYLLNKCKKGLVVKLPTFIGSPCNMFSVEKLKGGLVEPYGSMELISVDEASIIILKNCFYEGKLKIIKANGEVISAKLLYDIYKKIGIVDE